MLTDRQLSNNKSGLDYFSIKFEFDIHRETYIFTITYRRARARVCVCAFVRASLYVLVDYVCECVCALIYVLDDSIYVK